VLTRGAAACATVMVGASEDAGTGAPQLGQKWLPDETSAEQRAHRAMVWD